jgi:hypothetical protein
VGQQLFGETMPDDAVEKNQGGDKCDTNDTEFITFFHVRPKTGNKGIH